MVEQLINSSWFLLHDVAVLSSLVGLFTRLAVLCLRVAGVQSEIQLLDEVLEGVSALLYERERVLVDFD